MFLLGDSQVKIFNFFNIFSLSLLIYLSPDTRFIKNEKSWVIKDVSVFIDQKGFTQLASRAFTLVNPRQMFYSAMTHGGEMTKTTPIVRIYGPVRGILRREHMSGVTRRCNAAQILRETTCDIITLARFIARARARVCVVNASVLSFQKTSHIESPPSSSRSSRVYKGVVFESFQSFLEFNRTRAQYR